MRRGALLVGACAATLWAARVLTSPDLVEPRNPELLNADLAQLVDEHLDAVRDAPQSARAWAELGAVYQANSLWEEARDSYMRAAELDPAEPLWPYHAGMSTHEIGDTAAAHDMLRAVTETFDDFRPGHFTYGRLVTELGEFEQAKASFGRVVELDPYLPDGYTALADIELRMDEPARALELLERALALFPDTKGVRYLRGMALVRLGRDEEARAELDENTVPATPTITDEWKERLPVYYIQVHRQLEAAQQFMEAGRNAQAIEILEAALGRHPDDVRVQAMLGTGYVRDARPDWGVEMLERAAAAHPDDYSARVNLATCYLMLRRAQDALREAERAVVLAPDDSKGHLVRCRALRGLGRLDDAWAAGQEAWQRAPQDSGIMTELITLSEARGVPVRLETQRTKEPSAAQSGRD